MTDAMDQLRASLKAAPVIWKGDYPYFIHPITDGVPRMDPAVLQAITELAQQRVNWSDVDVLLGIEAMGLPLTAPLSMATGVPLVIARKRSYGLPGEVGIDQTTGYSKGAMYLNDLKPGERVAIVDDVLSTGGTLEAVIEGVRRRWSSGHRHHRCGGKGGRIATVAGGLPPSQHPVPRSPRNGRRQGGAA